MKKLINTIVLLSLISATAPTFASSAGGTVDLTLSPVYTAVGLVKSALVTVVAPFATTSELASLKALEDLRVVEDDAVNYLATEEPTDNLISTVEAVQELVPELQEKDFDTVVVTILEAIK